MPPMSRFRYCALYCALVCCLSSIALVLAGCGGSSSSTPPPSSFQLSIQAAGAGGGTISSNPAGINCGPTCSASFTSGSQVTLTETAGTNSSFGGWAGGGCSGNSPTCAEQTSARSTRQHVLGRVNSAAIHASCVLLSRVPIGLWRQGAILQQPVRAAKPAR